MSDKQSTALRVERLRSLEQFERCVEIQQATWSYSPHELFPRRAFLLAEKLGGHVLGAFDADTIVAFNVAYPGYRDGHAHLHSQMLAVLPDYRNSGVGRALKLAQRDIALADGFDLIEWTYDPLEIKNAFFNLHRLGAISRRYVRDFYGPSSSPLQGGLPTDRLYAEWWIRSRHVQEALESRHPGNGAAQKSLEVPSAIYTWKREGDERAATTQTQVRNALEQAFASGLAATNYLRGEDGRGIFLLDQPPAELLRATRKEPSHEA